MPFPSDQARGEAGYEEDGGDQRIRWRNSAPPSHPNFQSTSTMLYEDNLANIGNSRAQTQRRRLSVTTVISGPTRCHPLSICRRQLADVLCSAVAKDTTLCLVQHLKTTWKSENRSRFKSDDALRVGTAGRAKVKGIKRRLEPVGGRHALKQPRQSSHLVKRIPIHAVYLLA